MIEIKGKYASAKIFTDDVEEEAVSQIKELLNQPFAKDSHPRFMPDVHAGKGCTIGTTMHIKEKVCPNLVGVDISCGMLCAKLPVKDIDFEKFDRIVHEKVPAGNNVHDKPVASFSELPDLKCWNSLKSNQAYFLCSLGTLGGGNHFIEIDKAKDGSLWLIIHSGSRNLGKTVCDYYMQKAQALHKGGKVRNEQERKELIEAYKREGRTSEIPDALKALSEKQKAVKEIQNKDLAVIEGYDLDDYLSDCAILNRYAKKNRETMAEQILSAYGWHLSDLEFFHTIHNYIDTEARILRKGAISAKKGEKLIIPLNMRDGCIIAYGKGNPDWNESGPHGAGRKMSRSAAKRELDLEEFRETMKGIYSTTVDESTIDEAPFAYKDSVAIIENVGETVEILEIIKPVYNFKAAELNGRI
ncbi:MAG: RtcB family protein [Solobacterium sp.]|nr:RtcB family protein [Solobacterium sp.]